MHVLINVPLALIPVDGSAEPAPGIALLDVLKNVISLAVLHVNIVVNLIVLIHVQRVVEDVVNYATLV